MPNPGTALFTIDLSAVPEVFRGPTQSIVLRAKELLENGEPLAAIAFVGNSANGNVVPFAHDFSSAAAKLESAEACRKLAVVVDADWVLQVHESWALPRNRIHLRDDIRRKCGSFENYPGRLDVVSFVLETRERYYFAMPTIRPKGLSKHRRTIGPVVFEATDPDAFGTFTHLLPKKAAS